MKQKSTLNSKACRQTSRRCSTIVFALLVCCSKTVWAKNQKTPLPTDLPSMQPSRSQAPSFNPTPFPSLTPSSEPTRTPSTFPTSKPTLSNSPSQPPTTASSSSPTSLPTTAPTISLSNSPSLAHSPTVSGNTAEPTSTLTSSPTTNTWKPSTTTPTSSLSKEDSSSLEVSSVSLPVIGIDLVVSDSDAAAFHDTVLIDFIANILDVNTGMGTFDTVSLDFLVIQSDFSRRLSSGLSIRIEGLAYYGGEAPTSESLIQTLQAYFSFWGVQDLESYLFATGLTSVRVIAVSIDGILVERVGTTNNDNTGAHVKEPSTSEEKVITPGIIGGLIAGTVVLLFSIWFFVVQSNKGQRRRPERRRNETEKTKHGNTKSSSKTNFTGRIGARPISYNNTQEQAKHPSDIEYGSDGISVDNSLYTSDDSAPYNPKYASYDPSRLDKVIAAVKLSS